MVGQIRTAEAAMGQPEFRLTESEQASRIFRRSLFVVEDVSAGEILTRQNVRSIRPGNGLAPELIEQIVGLKAKADIPRGTPLSWALVGPGPGERS
jgi:sialic acid synthase SpsE